MSRTGKHQAKQTSFKAKEEPFSPDVEGRGLVVGELEEMPVDYAAGQTIRLEATVIESSETRWL